MRTRALSITLLLVTIGLLAYQQGVIRPEAFKRVITPPATAVKRTANWASPAGRQIGVTTGPLARNWWHPWQPSDLASVDSFENDARTHATIVMWFADWRHNRLPSPTQLKAIYGRGSVPEITWEPWNARLGLYKPQPRYRLSNITAGKFDSYIRAWARSLAAFKHPVLLRFAQEMDGNWFPWSDYANGNHPGEFVQAWRHVHRIFDLAGARNVKWVWSPAFANPETFPGRGWVDVLATTCQNGDRRLFTQGWLSFQRVCGPKIKGLHALAPGRPIQLAEVSTSETGGSKAAWIKGMFAYLAHHPEVRSLLWFNLDKETDWWIESSPAAERAFASGVRSLADPARSASRRDGGRRQTPASGRSRR